MPRFALKAPEALAGDERTLYDEMTQHAVSLFGENGDNFIYKQPDGAFQGPFTPFLATPELSRAQFAFMAELSKLPGLPPRARETAILVTGARFQAAFETYSHERIAVATTELRREQVDKLKVGEKPDDLDDQCGVAFDVAKELTTKTGPLREALWVKSVELLGTQGSLALLHYIGFYCHICVFLNGCDVPLPEGEEIL